MNVYKYNRHDITAQSWWCMALVGRTTDLIPLVPIEHYHIRGKPFKAPAPRGLSTEATRIIWVLSGYSTSVALVEMIGVLLRERVCLLLWEGQSTCCFGRDSLSVAMRETVVLLLWAYVGRRGLGSWEMVFWMFDSLVFPLRQPLGSYDWWMVDPCSVMQV